MIEVVSEKVAGNVTARYTGLSGVVLIERPRFEDSRGYFTEMYHSQKYHELGITCEFVQDNVSFSKAGVLRGLHYQIKSPQAKLVSVLQGEIYDVAVDIRSDSETFGHWFAVTLSAENGRQLFVPEGYAHGFLVTSESAVVHYKCSRLYRPNDEYGVLWSDDQIQIDWPAGNKILSEKDQILPRLKEIEPANLPTSQEP